MPELFLFSGCGGGSGSHRLSPQIIDAWQPPRRLRVTEICFNRQKINLSTVFAGQNVGIKQVSDHIWLVTFIDYDLGYFDHETCRLEPLDNPFGPKVLPMFSV